MHYCSLMLWWNSLVISFIKYLPKTITILSLREYFPSNVQAFYQVNQHICWMTYHQILYDYITCRPVLIYYLYLATTALAYYNYLDFGIRCILGSTSWFPYLSQNKDHNVSDFVGLKLLRILLFTNSRNISKFGTFSFLTYNNKFLNYFTNA